MGIWSIIDDNGRHHGFYATKDIAQQAYDRLVKAYKSNNNNGFGHPYSITAISVMSDADSFEFAFSVSLLGVK
jgi:hypothetical protein